MSSARCRHVCLCLVALMLVIVRTAGAHAHLCYDGKEPPATIHLGDGGSHPCENDGDVDHSGDKDVLIGEDLVLKKAPQADPWAPALLQYAFLVAAPVGDERIEFVSLEPRVESVAHLRPPLRGPPA
jgi:hypothetical protein